jgi:hypothetical protein
MYRNKLRNGPYKPRCDLDIEIDLEVDLIKVRRDCMDWIHMPQDRNQWRAFVTTVLNLLVPKNDGNSCVTKRLAASLVGLSSTSITNESLGV